MNRYHQRTLGAIALRPLGENQSYSGIAFPSVVEPANQ
jgi:hypothetical protein